MGQVAHQTRPGCEFQVYFGLLQGSRTTITYTFIYLYIYNIRIFKVYNRFWTLCNLYHMFLPWIHIYIYMFVAHIIYLHKDWYSTAIYYYLNLEPKRAVPPKHQLHSTQVCGDIFRAYDFTAGTSPTRDQGFLGGTHDSTGHGVVRNWWSFYWGKKIHFAASWMPWNEWMMVCFCWFCAFGSLSKHKLYFRNHTKETKQNCKILPVIFVNQL